MEKVSVIIPFYNCQYVDQAIASVLNQSYPNIEIIVVNDGSTKYVEKLKPFLSDINLIEKNNGGTASALNAGVKHATGCYFSWLSSDDLYKPERITRQLSFMKANQSSVSFSNYQLINEHGEYLDKSTAQYFNKLEFLRRFLRNCPINGCTILAEMEIFQKVGLFDETLRYANDYDMWCRLILMYPFLYFDEMHVLYRQHKEMDTKKYTNIIDKESEIVKNKYQLKIRNLIKMEKKRGAFSSDLKEGK